MNSPSYPVLYSFRRCPYAIRARTALLVASIKCEIREVILQDKPEAMLALSNKGTVPVLQLEDGRVIDESLDLMLWALEQSDPEHWLDADNDESRSLIEQNDKDFKDKLDRYKYFSRFPEHPQLYYRQQAEEFLNELEQRLADNNGAGLIDKRITLADVAIFPFIRQFAHVDYLWFNKSTYTKTGHWLESFEKSDLFLRVMQKYKLWTLNSNVEIFS